MTIRRQIKIMAKDDMEDDLLVAYLNTAESREVFKVVT